MTQSISKKTYIIALVPIILSSFLSLFSRSIYGPALPQIAEDLNATYAQVVGTISTFLLTLAITAFFVGIFVDYYNKRKTLLLGIFINIIGAGLCATATNVMTFTIGQSIQGVAGSIILITSQTWLTESSTEKTIVKLLAYFSLVLMIAPIIAPAFGGFLTDAYSWRSIFYLIIGLSVLILILVYRSKSPYQYAKKSPSEISLASTLSNYSKLLFSRKFIYLNIISLSGYLFQSVFMSISSFMFIADFGYSATSFGLVSIPIVISLIVGRFPTIYLERKWGKQRTLVFNALLMIISVIGSLAYYICCDEYNAWVVLAQVCVFNVGFCGYNILSLSSMMLIFQEMKGVVSAMTSSLSQIVNYLGALSVQLLYSYHFSNSYIYTISSIILLTIVLLTSITARKGMR